MNVCEMGSADWWLVVESTPDNEEAIDLLNRYRKVQPERTLWKVDPRKQRVEAPQQVAE